MIPSHFPAAENPARAEKSIPEKTFCDKPTENPLPLEISDSFFLAEEEEYFCFEI